MFSTSDTIVAIATPPGRGGLGVIRLSGPQARTIVEGLLGRPSPLKDHVATFGRVRSHVSETDPASHTVDEVIATWFRGPRSYTREDVVEVAAHGSPPVLNRIVELAVDGGARLAEPGEFTLRAYVNGRLDLVQAEAVVDLVDAVTPLQARAAVDQLEGTLTERITAIEARLFDLIARLEASIDFPDEGFQFVSRDLVAVELAAVTELLSVLAEDGRRGRLIREGAVVAIVGRPNAGKSSLFNALVGSSRAIVTEVPGTTRDALAERVDVGGVLMTLVDTAGLREARDVVEAEGVRRARQVQEVASLLVVVIDGSAPIDVEDRVLVSSGQRAVVVASKADAPTVWSPHELDASVPVLGVSAVTGVGLAALRRRLVETLTSREDWRDPPAVTNIRHTRLVRAALDAVGQARETALAGGTEELVLVDLSSALDRLGEVTGRRTSEDLLTHIFSRFCVGK